MQPQACDGSEGLRFLGTKPVTVGHDAVTWMQSVLLWLVAVGVGGGHGGCVGAAGLGRNALDSHFLPFYTCCINKGIVRKSQNASNQCVQEGFESHQWLFFP